MRTGTELEKELAVVNALLLDRNLSIYSDEFTELCQERAHILYRIYSNDYEWSSDGYGMYQGTYSGPNTMQVGNGFKQMGV